MQHGYPVLPGFVVPADVCFEFLSTLNSTPLIADLPNSSLHIDVDNYRQLRQVAQTLQQEILTATLSPKLMQLLSNREWLWQTPALIFRPSLGLNVATDLNTNGLLSAQIICSCDDQKSGDTERVLALALKRTWSQLVRARSLVFWQQHGIEWKQINKAVLVQPLKNAVASGMLNYNSPDVIEITACWGLGIAHTQGEVLPDYYLVDAITGAVRSQQLGNKTLAYGLSNSPFLPNLTPCATPLLTPADANCLQTYLPSETQQHQHSLDPTDLQQLIQLAFAT